MKKIATTNNNSNSNQPQTEMKWPYIFLAKTCTTLLWQMKRIPLPWQINRAAMLKSMSI